MNHARLVRSAAAAAFAATASVAQASIEATGTEGVAEMDVSGKQFGYLVGGLVAFVVVVFGVMKVMGRKKA